MADSDMELKVLVVDDHAITLAGLEGLLTQHLEEGSEVSSCSDTSEALEVILEQKPDIVVCDLDSEVNERVDLALPKQLGKQNLCRNSSCIRALM